MMGSTLWSAETGFEVLDGIKLIPFAVAILSRVFLLHDKVSDLLRIRRGFDNANILKPLAAGVGFPTWGPQWKKVRVRRNQAMTRTFYRYASFTDPKIDTQLVRTAADRWGWFWCTVEPQIVLAIAAGTFIVLGAWIQLVVSIGVMAVLILFGLVLWSQLKASAARQVDEILNNEAWKHDVRFELDNIVNGGDLAD
jgi:hypothetical protein